MEDSILFFLGLWCNCVIEIHLHNTLYLSFCLSLCVYCMFFIFIMYERMYRSTPVGMNVPSYVRMNVPSYVCTYVPLSGSTFLHHSPLLPFIFVRLSLSGHTFKSLCIQEIFQSKYTYTYIFQYNRTYLINLSLCLSFLYPPVRTIWLSHLPFKSSEVKKC